MHAPVVHGLCTCCCAEALTYLDRTSASGAALATDILCNRALTLLRQSPSDPEAALLDASAAIHCSKANCKVKNICSSCSAMRANNKSSLVVLSQLCRLWLQQLFFASSEVCECHKQTSSCSHLFRHGTAGLVAMKLSKITQRHVMMLPWPSNCQGEPAIMPEFPMQSIVLCSRFCTDVSAQLQPSPALLSPLKDNSTM